MSKIIKLVAKEILDSRGTPTVSVLCSLENGAEAKASAPSGVSTGIHEAHELRDGDMERFSGKGVQKAVLNINEEIFEFIHGKDFNQETLDEALIKLDGTKNKSRLGGNAILAASLAFARAVAKEKGVELYEHLADLYFKNSGTDESKRTYKMPEPVFNTIEGGKHSDSGLAFQEFLLVPLGFESVKTKLEVIEKVFESLKNFILQHQNEATLGDEGGFAPKLASNEEALEFLEKAISDAGYNTEQIKIALDAAATSFFKDGSYLIDSKNLDSEEMIEMYEDLCAHHAIISIEDGLYEEDFAGFAKMNEKLGRKINIVGDDITVTNATLIKKAIENKSINTLLIKPNQIGTLTETFQAIKMAKENDIKVFISHRGGETMDTFIADLAVAVNANYIKAGGPTKPERMAKYKRLIEIENII